MSPEDDINHPKHYTSHPSGVECITITECYGFNIGNAIKYLWRAGLKTTSPKKDLQKAQWYVNRELARCLRNETDAASQPGMNTSAYGGIAYYTGTPTHLPIVEHEPEPKPDEVE